MATDLDIRLDGVDRVSAALKNAQRTLKADTVPVIQSVAKAVASGARSRAVRHPSGLWRSGNGRSLSPSYSTRKRGEYWWSVQAGNAPEAISEFARLSVTPQGAAMVRALDDAYGRGGGSGNGRILWATMDDMADSLVSQVQAATDRAASDIEKQMGSA